MRSITTGIIAGVTGALFGAISMYFVIEDKPPVLADNGPDPLIALYARMDQTEALLREIRSDMATSALLRNIRSDMATSEQLRREVAFVQSNVHAVRDAQRDSADICYDATADTASDMAYEEAIVENITTRLYDRGYADSTTISDVMQSEDMLTLSDESRERVVSEMVGMLNRGEIDASTFLTNGQAQ
ncbi:MAG: hypothetical protein ABFR65_03870 [Pseudomonadota bacterium]